MASHTYINTKVRPDAPPKNQAINRSLFFRRLQDIPKRVFDFVMASLVYSCLPLSLHILPC